MDAKLNPTPQQPVITYAELSDRFRDLGLLTTLQRALSTVRCIRVASETAEDDQELTFDVTCALEGVSDELLKAHMALDEFQAQFVSPFNA